MGECETGLEFGGARGRQPSPGALSMMLPRRILVRVETLERRLGRAVPTVLSAEARAHLDAVLASFKEPIPERREDGDDRP